MGVPSTQESDPHQHLFPTSRLQQSPSVPPLGSVSGHKLDYPAPSYSSSHTLMGYSPLGLSQPVASPHLPSSFPSPQPPGGGGQQQGGSVVTKQEQFPNPGGFLYLETKIHQNDTISISGPGDPSQQSTSASTASIAELNQSTSKGHEILNQVYFLFSLSASHIFLGHEVKIPISHVSFIFFCVTYFLRSRHPQSFLVDIFFVQVFQQATMPIRLVPVRARKYPNRPSKTPVRTSLDRCCI